MYLEKLPMINFSAIGLVLDIIGFAILFIYGGFDIGKPPALLIGGNTPDKKGLKILGATLVIIGFCLQFYGSID